VMANHSNSLDRFFREWPDLVKFQLPRVKRSFYPSPTDQVALHPHPSFSHLSLAISRDSERVQIQQIVAETTTSLTHLEITCARQIDLAPIFTSPPINLKHLTCTSLINFGHLSNQIIPDYLDKALPLLVNLSTLEIGLNGITNFAFIEHLPKLRGLTIRLYEQYGPAHIAHVASLFNDLTSRLTKNRFDSISINSFTPLPYPARFDYNSVPETCTRLGIKFFSDMD
jgi:hypothetical protein